MNPFTNNLLPLKEGLLPKVVNQQGFKGRSPFTNNFPSLKEGLLPKVVSIGV